MPDPAHPVRTNHRTKGPNMNWQAKKLPGQPGWAVNTPSGDQYATAHTQAAAIDFATQMAGITALLDRVHTGCLFARHRKRVTELLDEIELITNAKVPVL